MKTSTVRFTLNFANKTIVGSKASFAKAGKGFGPEYEELIALIEKHPDFGFEEKAPKQPPKPRQSYKGLDIAFMRDFLIAIDDSITLKTLDDVVAFAEANGLSKYPLAKRMLFETYDNFDYVEAKSIVDKYRYERTKTKADALAAAIAADKAAKKFAALSETQQPSETQQLDTAA